MLDGKHVCVDRVPVWDTKFQTGSQCDPNMGTVPTLSLMCALALPWHSDAYRAQPSFVCRHYGRYNSAVQL